MIYKREQRETVETATLAPYALKSVESQGRIYPEPESSSRTAF